MADVGCRTLSLNTCGMLTVELLTHFSCPLLQNVHTCIRGEQHDESQLRADTFVAYQGVTIWLELFAI